MFKDTLKQNQPIVYKIIDKLVTNKRLSHAFLLSGIRGSLTKETAIYLAQILVCDQDKFACEKCDTCINVKNDNYVDLVFLDGSKSLIKKEDIEKIQERFNRTGLGRERIYIIHNIENSTPSALNGLLKFIEEPENNITGILTCENIERVLPTIVSRCQIINFKNPDSNIFYSQALQEGANKLDAYILSNIAPSLNMIDISEGVSYRAGLEASKYFIENFNTPYKILYYMHNEVFEENPQRVNEVFAYTLDILSLFFKNLMEENTLDLGWYSQNLKSIRVKNPENILMLILETRDKVDVPTYNIKLIFDQFIYRLIKEEEDE